jgi:hypothetical protein
VELVLTALAGPQRRPPAPMRRHSPSGERGSLFGSRFVFATFDSKPKKIFPRESFFHLNTFRFCFVCDDGVQIFAHTSSDNTKVQYADTILVLILVHQFPEIATVGEMIQRDFGTTDIRVEANVSVGRLL